MKKVMSLAIVFMLALSNFGCQKVVQPEVVKETLLKEEIHYDPYGNVSDTVVYTYDKAGNFATIKNNRGVKTYEYEDDRVVSISDSGSTKIYHYNADKKMNQATTEYFGEVANSTGYEYDSVGNLVRMTMKQTKGQTIESLYSYNTDNLVTECLSTVEKTKYRTTFEYDKDGNCIKEINYVDDEKNYEITSVYENGLLMSQKHETIPLKTAVDVTYEYNETNRISKQLTSDDGDSFYTTIEYIYE